MTLNRYGKIRTVCCQYRSSLYLSFLKSLAPLFFVLPWVSMSAQTIEIALVDGRNGLPIVGRSSYVNAWVGSERKEAIVIPTDAKGVARIELTLNPNQVNIPQADNSGSIVIEHPVVKYDEALQINAPYVLCASERSNYSWLKSEEFSTRDILQRGYASPNTCGKAVASPQPGRVTLFVRPLTWWEKLKQ